MRATWTNFDAENLHSVTGPVNHSGLTTAQLVGVRAGRETNDLRTLDSIFARAGYEVGSEDWKDAHLAASSAWACTCEKRARILPAGRTGFYEAIVD